MNDTCSMLPDTFQKDIARAVAILKEGGCSAIFLFGSVVQGTTHERSDIDFAVEGCPKEKFFHLYSKLYTELDHLVDLVDLDVADPFTRYLKAHGELMRVG